MIHPSFYKLILLSNRTQVITHCTNKPCVLKGNECVRSVAIGDTVECGQTTAIVACFSRSSTIISTRMENARFGVIEWLALKTESCFDSYLVVNQLNVRQKWNETGQYFRWILHGRIIGTTLRLEYVAYLALRFEIIGRAFRKAVYSINIQLQLFRSIESLRPLHILTMST